MAPSGGRTGTGDWKTDGQHYRRCQGVHLSVPAAVRGTIEAECGLISKTRSHPACLLQSVDSFSQFQRLSAYRLCVDNDKL